MRLTNWAAQAVLLIAMCDGFALAQNSRLVIAGMVRELGNSVPGAIVTLIAPDGSSREVVADDQGRFEFDVVPGAYSVRAEMHGFFPVTVSSIPVDGMSLEHLLIFLQRDPGLTVDDSGLVRGPENAEAPPLGIILVVDPPLRSNQVMAGHVEVINRGGQPILLPVQQKYGGEQTKDGFLLMNLTAESDYQAQFNYWFQCFPPSCLQLQPGEAIKIPVQFHKSGEYESPQVYHSEGVFHFAVGLSLSLPGSRDRRTLPVVARYVLDFRYP